MKMKTTKEENDSRFRDRPALSAALTVLALGVVVLFCTVILFSSTQCRKAVDYAKQGDTQNAIAQYQAMNGLGKVFFGKKIQGDVLERYNLCLNSGNAATVKELTGQMAEAFEDFDPAAYIPRMEECAKAAVDNNDMAGAADMAAYILSLDPGAKFETLRPVVEAKLYDLALAEDFGSADTLIQTIPDCDLGGLVKGLAEMSYRAVFSSAELNLSNALGEKLKTYRQASEQHTLAACSGGEALDAFLDHYIKGCNAYGTYSELHRLCAAVSGLLDNAEDYMECAFGFAGKRNVSHDYAREAYSYAVQAYNAAVKYDTNQAGVAEFVSLCADYIANAEVMMNWEDNSVYLAAMNQQPAIEQKRDSYEAESAKDADSMESYSNEALNRALRAVYEG